MLSNPLDCSSVGPRSVGPRSVGPRSVVPRALALYLCATVTAFADRSDDAAFLTHRSQHTLNALIGLPTPAARAVQTLEWQFALEHNNQFMGGVSADELLVLDGESSELVIRHRQILSPCWQGEAVLPLVFHSGGVFDRAIDDWHEFFGLPNANRGAAPFDELNYIYTDSNGELRGINSSESGLGDIQLSIQRFIGCFAPTDSGKTEPIARIGIKLPTGSVSSLQGSGRFDLYADWQSPVWRLTERWRFGTTIGMLLIGRNSKLPDQQSIAAYGSLGTQFIAWQNLRLLAQLDWHTPFYESELRELGSTAVSVSFGLRWLLGSNHTIEMSFSEDAAVDTTPDITGRLAWTFRPRLPSARR